MVLRALILSAFPLGECDGLERPDFGYFFTLGGCGGLESTDFCHFFLWEGVVDLKGLILDNFHFGRTDFGLLADLDFKKSLPVESHCLVWGVPVSL